MVGDRRLCVSRAFREGKGGIPPPASPRRLFYAHINLVSYFPLFHVHFFCWADTKEKEHNGNTVRKDPRMGTDKSRAAFFPPLSIHIRREWEEGVGGERCRSLMHIFLAGYTCAQYLFVRITRSGGGGKRKGLDGPRRSVASREEKDSVTLIRVQVIIWIHACMYAYARVEDHDGKGDVTME